MSSRTDSIVEYIRSKYAVNAFVNPKTWIDPFSLSLSWEGRESLLEATKSLFYERFMKKDTLDRNLHKIGVIGGFSGIGKSRALLELQSVVPSWHNLQWTVPVIISYNNGNPPSIDRETMSASRAFSLRILYFALIAGKKVSTPFGSTNISFERFVCAMPHNILELLTPQSAIDVLRRFANEWYHNPDGVIYLAVDEINYLLDGDYSGQSEKQSFLKSTMISFGELLLSGGVFVFGVVAGTTVVPIERIFAESSHPICKLPIGLLSYSQCENLLENFERDKPAIWKGWKTCRAFKTLVADFASIPRKLEKLLRAVEDVAKDSINFCIDQVDFAQIYCVFQADVVVGITLKPYGLQLITAAILLTPVNREDTVLNDNGSWTYGALEAAGFIALATVSNGITIVQLPYSLFRKLVSTLEGSDTLATVLQIACNKSSEIAWQSFEELHATIEAIREMLLARSKGEDKGMYINEFYCSSTPRFSTVDDSLEFDLRPDCGVRQITSRFPPEINQQLDLNDMKIFGLDENRINVDANTAIVKNASGAPFDTFTVRQLVNGSPWLICGQQKLYQASNVTKALVHSEAEKVANAFSDGVQYVLVVVAPRISSDCLSDIPENCIILTGKGLEEFYGPIFSGRAILAMSGTKVDMNIATFSELKTVPNIGDTLANRIINIRKQEPLHSWEDALARVNRLPESTKDHWRF